MSAQHPRRPAAYARVAATGVSLAGAVALVGVMNAGARPKASSPASVTDPPVTDAAATTTTPAPPDSVVVIEVHRTVYVDEHGNPVDSSAVPQVPSTAIAGRPTRTTVPSRPRTTNGSSAGSGSNSTTTTAAPPTTVRRTTTVPACSGSGCP